MKKLLFTILTVLSFNISAASSQEKNITKLTNKHCTLYFMRYVNGDTLSASYFHPDGESPMKGQYDSELTWSKGTIPKRNDPKMDFMHLKYLYEKQQKQ